MKEVKIDILIDASKSAKSLNDLTKSLNDMKAAASELDPVSDEFAKLNAEIVKTDTKVKNLGKSLEGLDADAKAGEIGKLAGGLSAVGSAAALAFAGNEDAEKFFKTFATGIAVTNAVKGGIESYTASVKLLTQTTILQDIAQKAASAAQLVYTTAVGTSTGALKLFRLALIGTGIGAIIVGIGLLIANFDKVSEAVSNAVKRFREMGPVMKAILYPITLAIAAFDGIIFALEKLGVIDDENTKKMKANAEERVINTKKEGQEISDRYDLEIRKAAAAGKDVKEIEHQKRLAILENIKLQGEAIRAQIKATGEFTEDQKKQLEELTDLAKKTKNDLIVGDIAAEKERNDARIKANEDAAKKKAENEAKVTAAEKKEAERQLELQKQIQDSKINLLEDGITKEINKIKLDGERRREAIKGQSALDIEARELIAKETEAAVDKVITDAAAESAEDKATKDAADKAQMDANMAEGIQDLKDEANEKIRIEQAVFDAKSDLVTATGNILGNLSALAEQGSAESKALALAEIGVTTGLGFAQGLRIAQQGAEATGPAAPFAFPVFYATQIAAVLAAVGKAKSIVSSSRKGSAPSASAPSGGGSASAPSVNPASLFPTQQLQGAETEQVSSGGIGQQQQVIKAVVSERDVTAVQNRISNYEQRSEIG